MAEVVRQILVDTSIMTSTNAVAVEPDWSSGTTYALDALVNRDALVPFAGKFMVLQGRAWKSLVGSNHGNDPATDDGTHWKDQGPTLPWLMHSDSATRQTTHADSLTCSLTMPATELSTRLWIENILGQSLRVVQTDVGGEGVVFDETFDLTASAGITDPYAYSFEPIERVTEFLVTGMFPFAGSQVDVAISEAGQTCGIGALVTGFPRSLGGTRWDLSLSIKDYSTFEEDPFGDEAPVERPYKKTASFSTVMNNDQVDPVFSVLAKYRATPVLIIADPGFAKSAVWGIATFKCDVPGPAASYYSIDVRSRAI